jgi:cytochrome c-type biogenesis protein CcmH/NrfG
MLKNIALSFCLLLVVAMLSIFSVAAPVYAQETAKPAMAATPASNSDFDAAMHLYKRGHYAEAIPGLTRATAADPSNAAAWYFLGYANYVTGHHAEAQAAFDKAFEAQPFFDARPYYRRR